MNNLIHAMSSEGEAERRKIFRSIKARANAKRTKVEKMADFMTSKFGSMSFLILNLVIFIVWVLVNTGDLKIISIFDPFPFNLLTTIVSLEAIILAIVVLISQNREARVDDLREETHLQLNIISEREVTKLMKMVAELSQRQGIDILQDAELQRMIRPVSEENIEKRLEKEIL